MVSQETERLSSRCGMSASAEREWADHTASTGSRGKWNDKKAMPQPARTQAKPPLNARHPPACLSQTITLHRHAH